MTLKPRPQIVTWLSIIVLILSAGQFMGVIAWFSLPELSLTVPRGYLLAKNLTWGLIALLAGFGLFTGRRWALPLSTWGVVLYVLYKLYDVLLLRSSQFALQVRFFDLVATLGISIMLLWVLTRPGVRSFFRRNAG